MLVGFVRSHQSTWSPYNHQPALRDPGRGGPNFTFLIHPPRSGNFWSSSVGLVFYPLEAGWGWNGLKPFKKWAPFCIHSRGCKVCRETVGSSVWNIAKVREDIETTMAARKNIWDFNLESKPKPKKYNFELCRLNSSKVKFKSCDIGQHLSLFSLNFCLMRYLSQHVNYEFAFKELDF